MRKIYGIFLLCLVLLFVGCQHDTPEPELPANIEINYFYDEACGSCDGESEFREIIAQELEGVGELYPYAIHSYNVFQQSSQEVRDKVFGGLGFEPELIAVLTYPVLTVNGNVYTGHESIRSSIREAYLTAGEDIFEYKRGVFDPTKKQTVKQLVREYKVEKDHSTIVYFYRTVCEECMQVGSEIVSELPDTVMVDGKAVQQDIIRINTRSGRNADIIRAFFAKYDVPEDDQKVPIIFTADGYLSGYDSISASLLSELENRAGLGLKMPEE